jgi:hypothetical protein
MSAIAGEIKAWPFLLDLQGTALDGNVLSSDPAIANGASFSYVTDIEAECARKSSANRR